MTDTPTVFDRAAVRRNRSRAAAALASHDFLWREAADRVAERLGEVRRRFPLAVELGAHGSVLRDALAGLGGIETLVACDLSPALARAARPPALVADEERLPFAPRSLDLVLSSLSLHWVNDLPGALVQIARALKPDGLLLASLLGGTTLAELREALMEAELAATGGVRPRVSPFADARALAGLLQRAGFALPVVDSDTVEVRYPDALALMRDLRLMGEANAHAGRPRGFTPRAVLLGAAEIYARRFAGADGRVVARFEIVSLTAWAPAASQPKPLRPGSAAQRLADALGTV
ncbi:MAG: methyltransferase domain-containing protein, partial [Alphaproteobacteria bacterium]|nr:methyltransferase domain-containing protein [Alphaproteobacteria bacterium]